MTSKHFNSNYLFSPFPPPSRPSLSNIKLSSRRGIRGAASGLRAAPFDAENRTFLIAAVGLLPGGGFFLCSYALYLPPRF